MNNSEIKEKVRWGTMSSVLGNKISGDSGGFVKHVVCQGHNVLITWPEITYSVAERDQAHVQDCTCLECGAVANDEGHSACPQIQVFQAM